MIKIQLKQMRNAEFWHKIKLQVRQRDLMQKYILLNLLLNDQALFICFLFFEIYIFLIFLESNTLTNKTLFIKWQK